MTTELMLGILAVIQQVLPLLTTGTTSTNAITTIVDQLTKWLPLITKEIGDLYGPVKNIIGALSANPATTAEQLDQLAVLDAKVDTAFEAAAKDVDPDA